MTAVYLNGQYVPRDQATISVFDRGFLFADGIYEVVAFFNNRAPFIADHFARLQRSCQAIDLACPFDWPSFQTIVTHLAEQEPNSDFIVYCQVTRGPQPKRSHPIPTSVNPTTFLMTQAVDPLCIERLSKGFHAVSVQENRWHRCDIKSIALLANILALREAKLQDSAAVEAIYFDGELLHEGASSSIMLVKEGQLIAPPASCDLLPSITRQTIKTLATGLGIPFVEAPVTRSQVLTADELLLASASRVLYPIVKLDNQPVSDGRAGPIWLQLIQTFQKELTPL